MAAIIYPADARKYPGSVSYHNVARKWRYKSNRPDGEFRRLFDTKEEAEQFMKDEAIRMGIVKNIIHDVGDYFEIELTQDQRTKIDKEDIQIIESNIWFALRSYTNTYYVAAHDANHNIIYLHNLICPGADNNISVDHINRDPLDNRRANLRLADKTMQCINQGIRKDNISGAKGVHFNKSKGKWIASWIEDGKQREKSFAISKYGNEEAKRLAIEARQQKEREVPAYAIALDHDQ